MWIVYLVMAIVVVLLSYFWVCGIGNMHKKYPDYKGEEFNGGFDFDDAISDWDVTLMDGLEDEQYGVEPIHKFNNGRGAMLCNKCRTIISTGPKTDVLYCDRCEQRKNVESNWDIREYYEQMEKEVHSNRANLNK